MNTAEQELKLIIGSLVVENISLKAQVAELTAKLEALAKEAADDQTEEMD